MWLCRTGKKNEYYAVMAEYQLVFLPWKGYNLDLSTLDGRSAFRELVKSEMHVDNPASITNWSGQLYSFFHELQIGDLLLLPEKAGLYSLVRITGDYKYCEKGIAGLHHCRRIEFIVRRIPRDIFPQYIKYSLQAYRTLFHVKNEEEVKETIRMWEKREKLQG